MTVSPFGKFAERLRRPGATAWNDL